MRFLLESITYSYNFIEHYKYTTFVGINNLVSPVKKRCCLRDLSRWLVCTATVKSPVSAGNSLGESWETDPNFSGAN